MSAPFLPNFEGYKYSPGEGTIIGPTGEVLARVEPTDSAILFGYALANVFAAAALVRNAPSVLENLKTVTDLAERYGVGNDCDGNLIEAREIIAAAEVAP